MKKEKKAAPPANGGKGPPAGFRRMSAEGGAPWFTRTEGAVLSGEPVGRFTLTDRDGKERAYWQVKVDRTCDATSGSGKDAKDVTVDPGDIVNVGESKKMEVLSELLPVINGGGRCAVYVEVGEKIPIGGGKTMWTMEVYSKVLVPPKFVAPAAPPKTDAPAGTDEDLPF